jgi:4-hydroxyphenylacetate 3-monooxygenase
MGARSGNNYLSSLRKLKAEVWLDHERVADPTIHPAFVRHARAIASLYDLQMEHPAAMTYRLDDGDRVGMSFIQPATTDEVRKRGAMFRRWAENHGGRLTSTPDYFNTGLAAMAAASRFFAGEPAFGENLQNYYLEARRHDWCAVHTIAEASLSGADQFTDDAKAGTLLKLVERTAAGIVVDGARRVAASASLSEELLVLPSSLALDEAAAERFALAFAINCNARGLKLLCQIDPARAEMECVASFDHVRIPVERIFLCGDVARGNALLEQTNAVVNLKHQRAVGHAVAAELRLGLAASIAEARAAIAFPHVRERLADMIAAANLIRACLHAAETGAHLDQWGQFIPARAPLDADCALFDRLYKAS